MKLYTRRKTGRVDSSKPHLARLPPAPVTVLIVTFEKTHTCGGTWDWWLSAMLDLSYICSERMYPNVGAADPRSNIYAAAVTPYEDEEARVAMMNLHTCVADTHIAGV